MGVGERRDWFQRTFGLLGPITRGQYALVGFGLMLFKYLVEFAFVRWAADVRWGMTEYFNPLIGHRSRVLGAQEEWLTAVLVVWSLPFVWIGVTWTMRRAIDAGRSPWVSLLFFVPGVNYLTMLLLAVLPTREYAEELPQGVPGGFEGGFEGGSGAGAGAAGASEFYFDDGGTLDGARTLEDDGDVLRGGLVACAVTVLLGLGMVWISVYGTELYSSALFMGSPFVLGTFGGYLFNRRTFHSSGATISMSIVSLLLFAGLMMLFALEGIVCLAMAFPIGAALAIPGALLGRYLAAIGGPPQHASYSLAVLPLMLLGDVYFSEPFSSEVRSEVVVDAPPEVVWRHVVEFSELPDPSRWLFQMGLAYPMRARIEGEGVGAVRYCEFSTGPFVEPITVWDPPHRLAFDVAAQPPPMQEWSFYDTVDAPHLDGYLRCQRGEFRLVPLADGRTRLEGSTWYELDMQPGLYWKFFTDALIHSIHLRVLEHIERLAEADARASAPHSRGADVR